MQSSDSFRSNNTNYRSVYSKEKQQQNELGVLSESVVNWLRTDLGHNPGRFSLVLEDDESEDDIKADIDNDVASLRRAQLSKRQLHNSKHISKRSRTTLTTSKSTAFSSTDDNNNVVMKTKLEKKLAKMTDNVQQEEEEIEKLISRIADVESQIKNTKCQIREKKNKMYLKQLFIERSEKIKQTGREYQKQMAAYVTSSCSNQNETSLKGSETTVTINIKDICEKLKILGQRLIFSNESVDLEYKASILVSIEELIKSTSPKIFLKSISQNLKSSVAELNRTVPTENSYVEANKSFQSVLELLQQSRDNHVSRFVETENILNEIEELKEKIKELAEEAESIVKKQYGHIPQLQKYIISVLKSKVEAEASQMTLQKLNVHADALARQCQTYMASNDELMNSVDRITSYNEVLEEKQKNIQRLIHINQKTGAKISSQYREISNFILEHISPYALQIDALSKEFEGIMIKENKVFNGLDLNKILQIQINGIPRSINSFGIYRAFQDQFILDIKKILDLPFSMSAEYIFPGIAQTMNQGVLLESANLHFSKIMRPIHRDLHNHVRSWLSSIRAFELTNERNPSYTNTINEIERAVTMLNDYIEKQEESLLAREQPRLERENEKIEMAENLVREIKGILEERFVTSHFCHGSYMVTDKPFIVIYYVDPERSTSVTFVTVKL
ncbi:13632_t:CDS:10 [Ambispora gerdemannii]|uniref:13632_t:CDS:1 n=1 Tax=Ambispora gerdemannii TaxID=144530 RepID=A0A9N9GB02_9GLOM|nr:13632_t:CDS:10 [Ambispora gerdemannii]